MDKYKPDLIGSKAQLTSTAPVKIEKGVERKAEPAKSAEELYDGTPPRCLPDLDQISARKIDNNNLKPAARKG